ncbi:MAG: putative sugar nucleotidyl transferase [Candidatus Zixiibacteriota bacterium]
MTICVYEDSKWRQFEPLTLLRPVYALRPGILSLLERIRHRFPEDDLCLAARGQLAPLVAQTFREYPVNIVKRKSGETLFLNGRMRSFGNLPEVVRRSRISTLVQTKSGDTAAVLFKEVDLNSLPEVATPADYVQLHRKLVKEMPPSETSATLYDYIWDLIPDIENAISEDFERVSSSLPLPQNVTVYDGARLLNEKAIFLGHDVNLLPGAVVDATQGPVYIGDNTRVEPHAVILGPCYIGPNSVVLAGRIAGSSIGHTCRVGGEVETSVFQAYVNKYHAGFIGHSYVGQWVNFGAMTTNSDLKNNYSPIRVSLNGESYDTGSIKVGSFIGDHTKFGIGTLLTTGINIGVCCNIFGGGLVSDKEVASFNWGTTGRFERYRFDKVIETAQRTAERRNCELSAAETMVLEAISKGGLTDDGVLSFAPG